MKKIVLLLLVLIAGACNSKNEIPKPAKPIEKAVMEDILYDLALLQALKSYSPEKLTKNNINSKTYIYQKYKIDSIQLAENNKYYASDFAEYQIMFNHVAERLEKQKAEMDTLAKKEEKKTQKKKKDSLANISKLPENKPKN